MTDGDELMETIAATANRLRLIQSRFASVSEGERRGYLREELDRAMRHVDQRDADAFVAGLRRVFPSGPSVPAGRSASNADVAGLPPPATMTAAAPEVAAPVPSAPEKMSAFEMAEEIGKQWESLSREERTLIREQFQRDGVVAHQKMPRTQAVTAVLSIDEMDQQRAMEVLGLLLRELGKVDRQLTEVWQDIARFAADPGEAKGLFPMGAINECMADYLKNSAGKLQNRLTTSEQVERRIIEMRRLLLCFIGAVNQLPESFYGEHIAGLEPRQIKSFIRGGIGQDGRCWKRYEEVSKSVMDCEQFRSLMLRGIADYITQVAPQPSMRVR